MLLKYGNFKCAPGFTYIEASPLAWIPNTQINLFVHHLTEQTVECLYSHIWGARQGGRRISLCVYHASGSNIWKKTVEDCCQHEGLWPYNNFLDGIYKVIQNMTYEVVRRQYKVYNITKWNQKHQIEHQITVCWLADDVNVSHDISSIVSLFK